MPFKVAFGDIKPGVAGDVCGGQACALSVIPGEDPESIGRRVRRRFWWMRHQGLASRLRGNDGVVGAMGAVRWAVVFPLGLGPRGARGGLARDERVHAGNAAQRAIYPLVLQSGQSVSG